jgi:Holliday junction resolvasome RuvABC endonuclease subunit
VGTVTLRVLAIDPGLASSGWAILRMPPSGKPICERSGTWTTSPADGDTGKRVGMMGALFGGLARGVDLVVIEAWTYQGPERGGNMTATTIPRVIQCMRTLAEMRGLPVLEVSQQAAKGALGVKTKAGVRRAVEVIVENGKTKTAHAADGSRAGRRRR